MPTGSYLDTGRTMAGQQQAPTEIEMRPVAEWQSASPGGARDLSRWRRQSVERVEQWLGDEERRCAQPPALASHP